MEARARSPRNHPAALLPAGCGFGIGAVALRPSRAGLSRRPRHRRRGPLAPQAAALRAEGQERHLPVHGRRARRQLDLFDPKPKLNELDGQPCPRSFIKGERFAFIKGAPSSSGSPRQFGKHGAVRRADLGASAPPGDVVDDIAIVRSMHTEQFNHGPAQLFMNTGHPQFGRPSMGSWLTYGIGSETTDLPGFVVLLSGRAGRRRRARLGQRLPADRLSGRAVPLAGRAGVGSVSPPGMEPADAAAHARRDRDAQRAAPPRRRRPGDRRRGSPPTRWPTACRPACPS